MEMEVGMGRDGLSRIQYVRKDAVHMWFIEGDHSMIEALLLPLLRKGAGRPGTGASFLVSTGPATVLPRRRPTEPGTNAFSDETGLVECKDAA